MYHFMSVFANNRCSAYLHILIIIMKNSVNQMNVIPSRDTEFGCVNIFESITHSKLTEKNPTKGYVKDIKVLESR